MVNGAGHSAAVSAYDLLARGSLRHAPMWLPWSWFIWEP